MRIAILALLLAACGSSSPQPSEPSEPAATCPESLTLEANLEGGACIDATMLGAAVADACSAHFLAQGWPRNPSAEAAMSAQTGKTLVCHQKP